MLCAPARRLFTKRRPDDLILAALKGWRGQEACLARAGGELRTRSAALPSMTLSIAG